VNAHDRSRLCVRPDIPRNVRIARWLLFRLLSGIRGGSLTLREGAQTFHFGETSSALHADVQILTPGVYWRVLTGGSLAAAEAWMDGEWETTHLTPLLEILALNGEVLGRLGKRFRARQALWSGCATGRGVTPARRRVKILPPITIWAPFMPIFWIRAALLQRAVYADEQDLTAAQQAKMARLCDQLALNRATCWKSAPAGGDGGIRGPSLRLSGDHHAVAGAIYLGNRADRPRRVAGSR
jgi:cyclopropane-fatty-acyl-phospholipid synthase